MLSEFTDKLYVGLEEDIEIIGLKHENSTKKIAEILTAVQETLGKLRHFILESDFSDIQEEVFFFKQVKPKFYSKYIYFISVYNFTLQRPLGSDDAQREHISAELAGLKRFFDHNNAFYQYYRSDANHLDELYFSRGPFRICGELDDCEHDGSYNTSHDYKLSKVIANEKYQDYLRHELARLNGDPVEMVSPVDAVFRWTSSKTDAVELIYSLIACGVLNNGNAGVKPFVDWFQKAFQIDLGNYYHKYSDMCNRKKDRTTFLDKMNAALIRRMDEKDDLNGVKAVPGRFNSSTR